MIKDLPKEDLPRERLMRMGAKVLSNEELLSVIFRTGTRGSSVKDLAGEVLSFCKEIGDLKNITKGTLENIKGLGPTKAVSLLAALELGRRVYSEKTYKTKMRARNAAETFLAFAPEISSKKQEHLLAIYVDVHRQVIAHKILFIGTVDRSTVHIREIFKEAFLESAAGIIIMHNHPSGIVTPSIADDELTEELYQAAKTFDLMVHDHIIVSEQDFYSYMEEGRIIYA